MKYLVLAPIFLVVFLSTSCYRMPEDGEVSTLPNTNNPSLTRHKETPLLPGFTY